MTEDQRKGETRVQESPKKGSELLWFDKACLTVYVIFVGVGCIFVGYAIIWGVWGEYVQPWREERKACAEWHESFPDRRLIEIVRKDVDGQTFDQIGDFYGVSGACIEKRINEDRELFDRLKAQYISRNY